MKTKTDVKRFYDVIIVVNDAKELRPGENVVVRRVTGMDMLYKVCEYTDLVNSDDLAYCIIAMNLEEPIVAYLIGLYGDMVLAVGEYYTRTSLNTIAYNEDAMVTDFTNEMFWNRVELLTGGNSVSGKLMNSVMGKYLLTSGDAYSTIKSMEGHNQAEVLGVMLKSLGYTADAPNNVPDAHKAINLMKG